ncbi:hypothetical protein PAAG_02109 [Paracoccidioides lutzii Pb01]|uniref:Uncharacterized protein n=1 Tax=Paracoccidioides lutzii (strain ATCC MYA-826 / Pb01) TaxID=502779 RepID=C1GUB4_PARBA|nr:hypothetical protein PAAG_02109 [Paracoccidioides lutzii Pb01]EEH39920.2 hypothetical protein PAAG_02109 [Paracoccidioides lutzii Pb01]
MHLNHFLKGRIGSIRGNGRELPKLPMSPRVNYTHTLSHLGQTPWEYDIASLSFGAWFLDALAKRTLTKAPGSPRKRTRLDSSDDGKSPPNNSQTTRKRRNTGNSSVALHRQRKVTSYAERSRRRALESQGRIEKTIFRIPQLIAQNKADLTKENDKTEDSEADEPVWDVLKQMKADAAAMSDDEQPQLPETPQAPQTPSRTWGIRGFLNSVPRTISKLIPTFTLSPNRPQSSVDVFTAPPESQMRPLLPAQPINTPQQNEQSEPLEQSEQTPDDGSLTYSLFPEPLNRRELLGISSPRKEAHQPSPDQVIETESNNVQHASNSITTNNTNRNKRKRRSNSPDEIPNPPGCSYGMDLTYFEYSSLSEADDDSLTNPDIAANIAQTRASIPASIPTPAPIHAPIPSTAQPAIRGILRNAKRVRFDASPENTPSKLRLRRNSIDSHQETASQDLSEPLINSLRNSSNDHSAPQSLASTQPGRDQLSSPESVQEPAQPIEPYPMITRPNPFGTYCLDYSVFSDSDEDLEEDVAAETATKESTAAAILSNTDNIAKNQTPSVSSVSEAPPFEPPPMTPTTATTVSAAPEPPEPHTPATPVAPTVPTTRTDASTSQPPVFTNNWTQLPPPRPTPAHVSLPLSATPVGSDVVAKLRSRAEKYKPKLPSGLRASRRYSSSPVSACEGSDILGPQPEPIEPLGESPLAHLNAQGERQATESRSEAVVGKENLLGDLGGSSEQTSHVPDHHITQLVREMWLEEDEGAADQIFGREFRRYSREQSRLGEPGLVGGEREVEEEEEEGEAAPIEPFNLGSYGEFCQELGEYRRERAS